MLFLTLIVSAIREADRPFLVILVKVLRVFSAEFVYLFESFLHDALSVSNNCLYLAFPLHNKCFL